MVHDLERSGDPRGERRVLDRVSVLEYVHRLLPLLTVASEQSG
jgi:hypothetical protein